MENKPLQEQVDRLLSIGINEVNVRKALMEKGYSIVDIEAAIQNAPVQKTEASSAVPEELSIKQHIRRLAASGMQARDIRQALLEKGFNEHEIDPILLELPALTQEFEKPASLNRKLWTGGTALFCFLLAFVLLPVNIIHSFNMFIAIVIAAIFAISLGMFLFSFGGNKNLFWPKSIISFISFFAFAAFFLWHETEKVSSEIENYGKLAVAKVIDGSSLSTRRGNSSKVTVLFKTEADKQVVTNVSVGKKEFEQFYQDQEIFVVYSTRHPKIVRLVRSSDDMKKYLKTPSIK